MFKLHIKSIFQLFILPLLVLVACFLTGGITSPFFIVLAVLIAYLGFTNDIKISIFLGIICCASLYLISPYSRNYLQQYLNSFTILVIFFIITIVSGILGLLEKKSMTKDYNGLLDVVKCLINAIDAKSPLTHRHTERVCIYSVKIGSALQLSNEDLLALNHAALLHDVGKIAIPDKILDKPSRLTDAEFEVIKSHTTRGYDILSSVEDLTDLNKVASVVLSHHEKFDGTGYPKHLKGHEIPYLARIVTIADSFDVMTSQRPYNKRKSIDDAIQELISCKWTHFDGNIVDVFVDILKNDYELRSMVQKYSEMNIVEDRNI
ncbi:MAG: HD domain-containing protein [Bacillota bacterium]|nr:HD domain-containing protein [Bacillota bacterium]